MLACARFWRMLMRVTAPLRSCESLPDGACDGGAVFLPVALLAARQLRHIIGRRHAAAGGGAAPAAAAQRRPRGAAHVRAPGLARVRVRRQLEERGELRRRHLRDDENFRLQPRHSGALTAEGLHTECLST